MPSGKAEKVGFRNNEQKEASPYWQVDRGKEITKFQLGKTWLRFGKNSLHQIREGQSGLSVLGR